MITSIFSLFQYTYKCNDLIKYGLTLHKVSTTWLPICIKRRGSRTRLNSYLNTLSTGKVHSSHFSQCVHRSIRFALALVCKSYCLVLKSKENDGGDNPKFIGTRARQYNPMRIIAQFG